MSKSFSGKSLIWRSTTFSLRVLSRFGFRRGCLVGNLGQEMNALPEAFRAQLTDVLIDWRARTERCLEAAKSAGQISKRTDCAGLAAFFWIGWEGAVLRAKLEGRAPWGSVKFTIL
jgi:TetR/AcrR family transcriptional repressor of nem operon